MKMSPTTEYQSPLAKCDHRAEGDRVRTARGSGRVRLTCQSIFESDAPTRYRGRF